VVFYSTGYRTLEELDFTLQKRKWRLQRMGAGLHSGRFWLASETDLPVSVPRILGGSFCCARFWAARRQRTDKLYDFDASSDFRLVLLAWLAAGSPEERTNQFEVIRYGLIVTTAHRENVQEFSGCSSRKGTGSLYPVAAERLRSATGGRDGNRLIASIEFGGSAFAEETALKPRWL
jgi:hypothetical protein